MNAEGAQELIQEMGIEMEMLTYGFAHLQRLFADTQKCECECEYELETLERSLRRLYEAEDEMRVAKIMLLRILDALREKQIIAEEGE